MSHQSRICAVFFDAQASTYEASTTFWSGALGRDPKPEPDNKYTSLAGDLDVVIQNARPEHEGMHLDMETDNVEAEVTRLEALGARKKYKIKDWCVMEAPGGHAFCVVPAYSDTWPAGAKQWD
ncbi:MAG: hypothetical protein ACI909_002717 [Planctomycetota bacterium]|jgi:hypothetical protein